MLAHEGAQASTKLRGKVDDAGISGVWKFVVGPEQAAANLRPGQSPAAGITLKVPAIEKRRSC